MSLKIRSVDLVDFRGYRRFTLDGLENLTIIVGPNAVGKTNIIEAIQLLVSGVSFRRPAWADTISWGLNAARASLVMKDEKRYIEHVVKISGGERTFEINGKKRGAASIRGTLACVLFIPDDLQLVKASSARRRDCVDSLGTQLTKQYSSLKSDYQQALKQRNLLLKEEIHSGPLFDSWNESLAVHGSRLCVNRWRLFDRLANHMKGIYEQIVEGETLDAVYIPSWERFDSENRQIGDEPKRVFYGKGEDRSLEDVERVIQMAAQRLALQELRRGVSLVGPHKDEIAFFINDRNARMFASQGQQRTLVLALKLAAVELIREMTGTEPVLLLDDVMSELDERHREALTGFVLSNAQTIITTTNLSYFSEGLLEKAKVIHVPIEGTRYDYSSSSQN